jgi:hypothetical protein
MASKFKVILNGGAICQIFAHEDAHQKLLNINANLNEQSKEITLKGNRLIKQIDDYLRRDYRLLIC